MTVKKYLKFGIITAILYLIVTHIEMVGKGIGTVIGVMTPLIVGVIMAYIMSLIMKPIERIYFPKAKNKFLIKSRRPVSILASFLIIVLILALIWAMVVPEIIASCTLIGKEIPGAFKTVQDWVIRKCSEIPSVEILIPQLQKINISDTINKLVNFVVSGTGGIINSAVGVVSHIIGGVTTTVIGIIFAVYMLYNREKLQKQFVKLTRAFVKIKNENWCWHALDVANRSFSSFIVGQCTEAVILGVLCTFGMLIFKFPYAAMTGTVVGVTALIPIVGAFMGAIIGAFMIFTVDPMQALFFLIFLIILMQIEGNLIYPRVVGNSIGLPGIWVLAAVTVGGGLFGIAGMLIGVPLTATIYKLLRESVNNRLSTEAVNMSAEDTE